MTNQEKLIDAFANALDIQQAQVTDTLQYNSIQNWDSTAHMVLVNTIESTFNIMLDTDDIIDMSSVAKAKEILQKYGVW